MKLRDYGRYIAVLVISAGLGRVFHVPVTEHAWTQSLVLAGMYVVISAIRETRGGDA